MVADKAKALAATLDIVAVKLHEAICFVKTESLQLFALDLNQYSAPMLTSIPISCCSSVVLELCLK